MLSRSSLPAIAAFLAVAANTCFWNAAVAQTPAAAPADASPPAVESELAYDTFIAWDNPAIDNVFTAPDPLGYFSVGHTTGSIFAINDLYFPGTVNVVTQDMIHDQQALSFSDVLRDIGGAVQTNHNVANLGSNLHFDQFLLRGLTVSQFNFRKNGFLDPTYTPRDLANVDRIEVLKGPAAVLYGAAAPAGTVNLITKKALQERFAWGGITLGSDSLQRYQFDVNSTNEAGDFLVRVNGVYQDGQSFRNFGYNERSFVAPTFTKLIGSDTAITWEGEFHQDRRMPDSGLIAANGNPRVFGIDTFFGAPTDFAEFNDYRSTLAN